MAGYFSAFPLTNYAGIVCTNITLRAKLLDSVKVAKTLYYPYTIKEGERPDIVAFNYYGACHYDWIVFLSNDIIDPYYDWPLDSQTFDAYIAGKYGAPEMAQQTTKCYRTNDVTWYQSINDNSYLTPVQFNGLPSSAQSSYQPVVQNDELELTPASYGFLQPGDAANWTAVDCYTWELEQNEAKRVIKLIDKSYVGMLTSNLQQVMNS